MLHYSPPVYFWIAEYSNGRALPQFDPSGEENKFSMVQRNLLVKFGWYPFSLGLAEKIHGKSGLIVLPTKNPVHTVRLNDGEQVIAKRETTVKMFKFRQCGKCGFKWQFTRADFDPLVNLPTSCESFVEDIPIQDEKGKHTVKYVSAVCPNCGYHDCNAVMIKDKKVKRFRDEKRATVYILGVAHGKVIRIRENGSVEKNGHNR